MSRIALLAGTGRLPSIWLKEAQRAGAEVVAYHLTAPEKIELPETVARSGLAKPDLSAAELVREVNPASLGELLSQLEADDISQAVMLGKIEKARLFQEQYFDAEMKKLLASLPDWQDETILKGFLKCLQERGIELLPQDTFLDEVFFEPGWQVGPFIESPEDKLEQELKEGLKLAQKLADFEVGQSLLLASGTVLAVEAVEGTDAAIKRAGKLLAGSESAGLQLAKASRPRQDFRLDIPTVGPETLETFKTAGGDNLVLEARGVLVLEKERFLELAAELKLGVLAI